MFKEKLAFAHLDSKSLIFQPGQARGKRKPSLKQIGYYSQSCLGERGVRCYDDHAFLCKSRTLSYALSEFGQKASYSSDFANDACTLHRCGISKQSTMSLRA
jgi:hypothetical protein